MSKRKEKDPDLRTSVEQEIKRMNSNVSEFNKKMEEVRREYIRKAAASQKSAAEFVLNA